jgi:short-subunit dehydrogenase
MIKNGKGTILFSGATASLRGSANFAGFAASKFALRALAQSMARELGPQGIHVAHIIIDGGINTPRQVQSTILFFSKTKTIVYLFRST